MSELDDTGKEPGRRSGPRRWSVGMALAGGLVVLVGALFVIRGSFHRETRKDEGPDFKDYVVDPMRPGELEFRSDPLKRAEPYIRTRPPLTADHRPTPKGRQPRLRAELPRAPQRGVTSPDGAGAPTLGIPHDDRGGRPYPPDPPPKRMAPVLRIVSEPSGLPVIVDGASFGVTPVATRVPSDKSRLSIVVRGIGYKDAERWVTPGPNGDFFVRVVMQPDEATAKGGLRPVTGPARWDRPPSP